MPQPGLLGLIPHLPLHARQLLVGSPEVFEGERAARVVGRYGGAAKPLAEDGVAGAEALGVVGLGEDAGLDLWGGISRGDDGKFYR